MSEQDNGQSTSASGTTENPVDNLKAEFSRKMSNLDANFAAIAQKLETLTTKVAPVHQESKPDLATLAVTDPIAYAEAIAAEADRRAALREQASRQIQDQNSKVINNIVSDFPEVNQVGHPLYDKVQEMMGKMSPEEKNNSSHWRAMVLEAAMDVGLKPRSKRSKEDRNEDFSLGGGYSGSSRAAAKPKLSGDALQFATLLGLDTKDPKVIKRLEERSQRNFKKFGSGR